MLFNTPLYFCSIYFSLDIYIFDAGAFSLGGVSLLCSGFVPVMTPERTKREHSVNLWEQNVNKT